jgi:hypothetical protein
MKTSWRICVAPSLWAALALFVWLPGATNKTSAQQLSLDESVIRQWKEYELFAPGLQGVKRENDSFSTGLKRAQTVSIKQNRECAILSEHRDDESDKLISLANPLYSAEIQRVVSDPRKTVLKRFGKGPNMILPQWDRSLTQTMFLVTSPHFSYRGTRLSELVSQPGFQIKKMVREDREGAALVRIEHHYSYVESKAYQVEVDGSLFLDPARHWCIRQVLDNEGSFLGENRYGTAKRDTRYEIIDHPSGFPLVKSSTTRSTSYYEKTKRTTEGTLLREYEWDVNDRLPNADFTLSAFGLPEPPGVKWEKPTPVYVWILAAAGASGALAFGAYYLARRRQAATAGGKQ